MTYRKIASQEALVTFAFERKPVYISFKAGAYYLINAGMDLPVSYFRKAGREFYVKEAE